MVAVPFNMSNYRGRYGGSDCAEIDHDMADALRGTCNRGLTPTERRTVCRSVTMVIVDTWCRPDFQRAWPP